jgi:hypothetical protein
MGNFQARGYRISVIAKVAGCLVVLTVLWSPTVFAQASSSEVTIKTAPVMYQGSYVAPTAAPAANPATEAATVAITTSTVVYAGGAPAPTAAPTIAPSAVQITTGAVIYHGP